MPGPPHRLQMKGRDVLSLMPVPPIGMQLRTDISMLSYADELTFGIIGDFDTPVDVEDLAHGIEQGVFAARGHREGPPPFATPWRSAAAERLSTHHDWRATITGSRAPCATAELTEPSNKFATPPRP